MDQERTSSILFLAFFILLLPFPLYSLHGDVSFHFLPFFMENVSNLHCDFSIVNKSSPLSSAATVFLVDMVKANSSASFRAEFSFSVHGSNGPAFFIHSEKLLSDEQVLSVEFGPLMVSKDILEIKTMTVRLPRPNKWIKKPELFARFDLAKTLGFGTSQTKDYGKKDVFLGTIYAPILALISIISAFFTYLKKLFTRNNVNPEIPPPETPASTRNSAIPNLLVGYQKFTYSELSAATNHFHESELLGTGIYASVYRAIFPGSSIIYAVKRFDQNISSKTSFQIEVTAIHRLRHDRILELRGWCDENPNEPLLVYDYMPNKSLDEALRNREQPLLWPQRYKIAIGVAEALVYLHEECIPMVIHSDIKKGNVMLDADFNPKLGDFGLAMSVPPYILWRESTEQDPPECQLDAEVTEKIDVYLYGSMVLGLCCYETRCLDTFSRILQDLKMAGKLLHVVDYRLGGKYNEEEMLRLLNVALQCLDKEIQERPSMKQVLQILKCEGDTEEPDLTSP